MSDEQVRDLVVLDRIDCILDVDRLMKRNHVKADGPMADEFRTLVAQAQALAQPKGMYRPAFIDRRDEGSVTIDGITLTSRVLAVNLENVHRVFMFVATCGVELDRWAHGLDDVLHQFWAESIKEAALGDASRAVNAHVDAGFSLGKVSQMNPGSLADWPLKEQRPFFALMGDSEAAIGVTLTESCLMVPNKSVSGLRFPVEGSFESCMLCPREACPGRRALYDAALYERRYASKS